MQLSTRSKNQGSLSARGFTIVELLIVIAVIGILAAIVIVAYVGITSRANNSRYKENAVLISKVAEARENDNAYNSYPTSSAGFTSTYTKLPEGVSINNDESTATVSSPPATADLEADAKNGIYTVNYCDGGLIIFYPISGQADAGSITVGRTTSC